MEGSSVESERSLTSLRARYRFGVDELAETRRVEEILATHDTVFVARVREVGIGGRGGRLRAWFVQLEIERLLRGAPFPHAHVVVYIHSPAQEFPRHDSKNLAGVRCVWAVHRDGDTFLGAAQLFAFDPVERAIERTIALLA